jgi:hypothetical protein
MARTRQQIKDSITTQFMANETLAVRYGFPVGAIFEEHFSIVSIENFLFEIVATAIYLHEQIFAQHTIEIDEIIRNQKTGRLPWYREMALKFQYGFNLVADRDYYDNTGIDDALVASSKIIKYAAANEAEQSSRVILKIAGSDGPVTDEQKTAFAAYVDEFKIAGTEVTIINYLPDRLYLSIQVKRDAQVLTETGMSALNGNYPVNEAIEEYLTELPFNGELKLSALVDKIQLVPGVLDVTVLSAETAWINPEVNDYGEPQPVFIAKIPESGYFEVVTYDNIAYVV